MVQRADDAKSNSDEEGKIEEVVEIVNPITYDSQTLTTLDAKVAPEIDKS